MAYTPSAGIQRRTYCPTGILGTGAQEVPVASIITRRRRARRENTEQECAASMPPVLPVVTMTVQADATLRVMVDGGEPFGPPTFAPPPWQRHSFAQIISEVVEQRDSPPVRVSCTNSMAPSTRTS